MHILFVLCTLLCTVRCEYPVFCKGSCTFSVDSKRHVFVQVEPSSEAVLSSKYNGGSEVFVPFWADDSIEVQGLQPVNATSYYNPYWQISGYQIGVVSDSSTVRINNTGAQPQVLLLKVGTKYKTTLLEVIGLPIVMFHLHGDYWTDQPYFWIFVILSQTLALGYALVSTRTFVYELLLLLAIGCFVSVGAEKLYHSLISLQYAQEAGLSVSDGTVAYAIAGISVGAELVPLSFSVLFMWYARYRPQIWCIAGLLLSAGFVFLAGAGWFGGPALIATACVLKMVQSR